jgi:hypothetical protein
MFTVNRTFIALFLLALLLCLGCALTQPTPAGQTPSASPQIGPQLITVNSDALMVVIAAMGGIVAGWLGLKRPGDIARPTVSPSQSVPTAANPSPTSTVVVSG